MHSLTHLKKERRIFDFNQGVHVLQARLHERKTRLERVVPVGDLLPDKLIRGPCKVGRQELVTFEAVVESVEFRSGLLVGGFFGFLCFFFFLLLFLAGAVLGKGNRVGYRFEGCSEISQQQNE